MDPLMPIGCSVVPERVHILGERELNVLFYCVMNVTVNSSILVSVKDTLSQFIFLQFGARF